MFPRICRYTLAGIVVLALTLLVATGQVPAQNAIANTDPVTAAWEKARDAIAYEFSSDVTQVSVPTATVANAGRTSQTHKVHLEGNSNLREQSLELQLWSQGGSVTQDADAIGIRIEQGQTYSRRGVGEWQKSDDLFGGIAPQGDFMAYLAAVRAVEAHEPETIGGLNFTRYSF
ncbi:MAG: hypothetical protein R2932_04345 [Caldilineaceae bacterium]